MKTTNKKIDTGYFVQKAETLISTSIAEIGVKTKTFAEDQARQQRPLLHDPMELYIVKIQAMFMVLLEQVLKMIGAFKVLKETPEHLKELYERETKKLKAKKEELLEDLRLLSKDLEGLVDISGLIDRWRYKWRIILIFLTFGEVAVNYKALLSVTPNQIVAILSATGLSIFLFVTAHSFKDIINYFSSRTVKIGVGILNVLLVILLLYGLNEIRISYLENDGEVISDTSKYSYIVLNFALWISGAIIALLYKPLKPQVEKHEKFQKVKKEFQYVKSEINKIDNRLEEIPNELEQKQAELHGLKCMAKHYENIISAAYISAVADFKEHNLFSRKDKITPKSFLEKPPKLKTYFDTINLGSDGL